MKSNRKIMLWVLVVVLVISTALTLFACKPIEKPTEEITEIGGEEFIYRVADSIYKKVGTLDDKYYHMSTSAYVDLKGDIVSDRRIRLDIKMSFDLTDIKTNANNRIHVSLVEEKNGGETEIFTMALHGNEDPQKTALYIDTALDNYPAIALTDLKPSVFVPILKKLNLNEAFYGIFKEDGMLSGILSTISGVLFEASAPLKVGDDGVAVAEVKLKINDLFVLVGGMIGGIEDLIDSLLPATVPGIGSMKGLGALIPQVLGLFNLKLSDIENFKMPQVDARLVLVTKDEMFESLAVKIGITGQGGIDENQMQEFQDSIEILFATDVKSQHIIANSEMIRNATEFSLTNIDIGLELGLENTCDDPSCSGGKACPPRVLKIGNLLGPLGSLFDLGELGQRTITLDHGVYGLKLRLQGDLDLYNNSNNRLLINITDSADTTFMRPLIRIAYDGSSSTYDNTLYVDAPVLGAKFKIPNLDVTKLLSGALDQLLGTAISSENLEGKDGLNKMFAESPSSQMINLSVEKGQKGEYLGYNPLNLAEAVENKADMKIIPLISRLLTVIKTNVDSDDFVYFDEAKNQKGIQIKFTNDDIAYMVGCISENLGLPAGVDNGLKEILKGLTLKLGASLPKHNSTCADLDACKDPTHNDLSTTGLVMQLSIDLDTSDYDAGADGGRLGLDLTIDPINVGWTPNWVNDFEQIIGDGSTYIDLLNLKSIDIKTSIELDITSKEDMTIDLDKMLNSMLGDILFGLNINQMSHKIVIDVRASIGVKYLNDTGIASSIFDLFEMVTDKDGNTSMVPKIGLDFIKLEMLVKIKSNDSGEKTVIKLYYDSTIETVESGKTIKGAFIFDASAVNMPKFIVPIDLLDVLQNGLPTSDGNQSLANNASGGLTDDNFESDLPTAQQEALDIMAIVGGVFGGATLSLDYLAINLTEKALIVLMQQLNVNINMPTMSNPNPDTVSGDKPYIIMQLLDPNTQSISLKMEIGAGIDLGVDGESLDFTMKWNGIGVSANGKIELPKGYEDFPKFDVFSNLDNIQDAISNIYFGTSINLKTGINDGLFDFTEFAQNLITAMADSGNMTDEQASALAGVIVSLKSVGANFGELKLDIDANINMQLLLADDKTSLNTRLGGLELLLALKGRSSGTVGGEFSDILSIYFDKGTVYLFADTIGTFKLEAGVLINNFAQWINNANKPKDETPNANPLAKADGSALNVFDIINNALSGVQIGKGGIGIGFAQGILDYAMTMLGYQLNMPDLSADSGLQIKLLEENADGSTNLAQLQAKIGLNDFEGSEMVYVTLGIDRLHADLAHKNIAAMAETIFGKLDDVADLNSYEYFNIGADIKISLKQLGDKLPLSEMISAIFPGFSVPIGFASNVDADFILSLELNIPTKEILAMLDKMLVLDEEALMAIIDLILDSGELKFELKSVDNANNKEYTFLSAYYSNQNAYLSSNLLGISGIKLTGVGDMISSAIKNALIPPVSETTQSASASALYKNNEAQQSGIGTTFAERTRDMSSIMSALTILISDNGIKLEIGANILSSILKIAGITLPADIDIAKIISNATASFEKNEGGEFEIEVSMNMQHDKEDVFTMGVVFGNVKLGPNKNSILPNKTALSKYEEINLDLDDESANSLMTFGLDIGFSVDAETGKLDLSSTVGGLAGIIPNMPQAVLSILDELSAYAEFENIKNGLTANYVARIRASIDVKDIMRFAMDETDKIVITHLDLSVQVVSIAADKSETIAFEVVYVSEDTTLYINAYGEKIAIESIDLPKLLNDELGKLSTNSADASLTSDIPETSLNPIDLINSIIGDIKFDNINGVLSIQSVLISASTLSTLIAMLGAKFILPEIPSVQISAGISINPFGLAVDVEVPYGGSMGGVKLGLSVGNLGIKAGGLSKNIIASEYKNWDSIAYNVGLVMALKGGIGSSNRSGSYPGNNINVGGMLKGLFGEDIDLDAIVAENMEMDLVIDAQIGIDFNNFISQGNDIIIRADIKIYMLVNGAKTPLVSVVYDSAKGLIFIDGDILDITGANNEMTKIAISDMTLSSMLTDKIAELLNISVGDGEINRASVVSGEPVPSDSNINLIFTVAAGVLQSALTAVGIDSNWPVQIKDIFNRSNDLVQITATVDGTGFVAKIVVDEKTMLQLSLGDFNFEKMTADNIIGKEIKESQYKRLSDIEALDIALQLGFIITAGDRDLDLPFSAGETLPETLKNLIIKLSNINSDPKAGNILEILAEIKGRVLMDMSAIDKLTIDDIMNGTAALDFIKMVGGIDLVIDLTLKGETEADNSKLMTVYYTGGVLYIDVPGAGAKIRLDNVFDLEELLGITRWDDKKLATADTGNATIDTIADVLGLLDEITLKTSQTTISFASDLLSKIIALFGANIATPAVDAKITIKHPNSSCDCNSDGIADNDHQAVEVGTHCPNNYGFKVVKMTSLPFGFRLNIALADETTGIPNPYMLGLEAGGLDIKLIDDRKADSLFDIDTTEFISYSEADVYLKLEGKLSYKANQTDIDKVFGTINNIAGSNIQFSLLQAFIDDEITFNLEARVNLANLRGMELLLVLKQADGSEIISLYYNGGEDYVCLDARGLINMQPIRIDGFNIANFVGLPNSISDLFAPATDATPIANAAKNAKIDALPTAPDSVPSTPADELKQIGVFFGSESIMLQVSGYALIAILETLEINKIDKDGNPIKENLLPKEIIDHIKNAVYNETNIQAGINWGKTSLELDLAINLSDDTSLGLSITEAKLDASGKSNISHKTEYTPIRDLQNISLAMELGVNFDLKQGLSMDFAGLLTSFLGGNATDYESGIEAKENIKGNYVLQLEAIINVEGMFAELDFENLQNNTIDYDVLLGSQIKLALRDKENGNKLMAMIIIDGSNNCILVNIPSMGIMTNIDSSIFDVVGMIKKIVNDTLIKQGSAPIFDVDQRVRTAGDETTGLSIGSILGLFSTISLGNKLDENGNISSGLFITTTQQLVQSILTLANIKLPDGLALPDMHAVLGLTKDLSSNSIFGALTLDLMIPHNDGSNNTSSLGMSVGGIKIDFNKEMAVQEFSKYIKLSNTRFISFGMKFNFDLNSADDKGELSLGLGGAINTITQSDIFDSLFGANIAAGLSGSYTAELDINLNVEFLSDLLNMISDSLDGNGVLNTNDLLGKILAEAIEKSELRLAIIDNIRKSVVTELMYIEGNVYCDMSYFGMPKFKIEDLEIGSIIDGLLNPGTERGVNTADGNPLGGDGTTTIAEAITALLQISLHGDKIIIAANSQLLKLIFAQVGVDFVIDSFEFSIDASLGETVGNGLGIGLKASLYKAGEISAGVPHTTINMELGGFALQFKKRSINQDHLGQFKPLNSISAVSFATDIALSVGSDGSKMAMGDVIEQIFKLTGLGSQLGDIDLGLDTEKFARTYNLRIELNVELEGLNIDFSNITSIDFSGILKNLKLNSLEAMFLLTSIEGEGTNAVVNKIATIYYTANQTGTDMALIALDVIDKNMKVRVDGLGLLDIINNMIGTMVAPSAADGTAGTDGTTTETTAFDFTKIIKLLQSLTIDAQSAITIDFFKTSLTQLMQIFNLDFALQADSEIDLKPMISLNLRERYVGINIGVEQLHTDTNMNVGIKISDYALSLEKRAIRGYGHLSEYANLSEASHLYIDLEAKAGYNIVAGEYNFNSAIDAILGGIFGDMPIPAYGKVVADMVAAKGEGSVLGAITLRLQGNIGINFPSRISDLIPSEGESIDIMAMLLEILDINNTQLKLIVEFQEGTSPRETLVEVFVNGMSDEILLSIPMLGDPNGNPLKVSLSNFNLGDIIGKLLGKDEVSAGQVAKSSGAQIDAVSNALAKTDVVAAGVAKVEACGCENADCVAKNSCFDTAVGKRLATCTCTQMGCLNVIDVVLSLVNVFSFNGVSASIGLSSNIYEYLLNLVGINVSDINESLANVADAGIKFQLVGGIAMEANLGPVSFGLAVKGFMFKHVPIVAAQGTYTNLNSLSTIAIDTAIELELNLEERKDGNKIKIGELIYPLIKDIAIGDMLLGQLSNLANLEIAVPNTSKAVIRVEIVGNFCLTDVDSSELAITIYVNNAVFARLFINNDQTMYLDAPAVGIYKVALKGARLKDVFGKNNLLPEGGFDSIIKGLSMAADTTPTQLKCGCANADCIATNSCFDVNFAKVATCNQEHPTQALCDKRYSIADLVLNALSGIKYKAGDGEADSGFTLNIGQDLLANIIGMLLDVDQSALDKIKMPIDITLNTEKEAFGTVRDITMSAKIGLYENSYAKLSITKFKVGLDKMSVSLNSLTPGETTKDAIWNEYVDVSNMKNIHIDTTISVKVLSDKFGIDLAAILKNFIKDLPDTASLKLNFAQFDLKEFDLVIKGNVNLQDLSDIEAHIALVKKSGGARYTLFEAYLNGAEGAVYVDIPMLNLRRIKIDGIDFNGIFNGGGIALGYNNLASANTAAINATGTEGDAGTPTPEQNPLLEIINNILGNLKTVEFSTAEGIAIGIDGAAIPAILAAIPGMTMDLDFIGDIVDSIALKMNVFNSKLEVNLDAGIKGVDENGSAGVFGLSAKLEHINLAFKKIDIINQTQKAQFAKYNNINISDFERSGESGISVNFGVDLDVSTGKLSAELGSLLESFLPGMEAGTSLKLNFDEFIRNMRVEVYANLDTVTFSSIEYLLAALTANIKLIDKTTGATYIEATLEKGILYIATDLLKSKKYNNIKPMVSFDLHSLIYGKTADDVIGSLATNGTTATAEPNILGTVFSILDSVTLRGDGVDIALNSDTLNIAVELLNSLIADLNFTATLPTLEKMVLSYNTPSGYSITNGNTDAEYAKGRDMLSATVGYEEIIAGKKQRVDIKVALTNVFGTIVGAGANDGEIAAVLPESFTANKDKYTYFDVATGLWAIEVLQQLQDDMVAGITLDFEIRMDGDKMISLNDIFADVPADAPGIMQTIASLFKNVVGNVGLTAADFAGKYRIEMVAKMTAYDFINFDLSTVNAKFIVSKHNGSAYAEIMEIVLTNGILYADLSGISYLPNVGKIKVDLIGLLARFNINIGTPLSTINGADGALAKAPIDQILTPGNIIKLLADINFGKKYIVSIAAEAVATLLKDLLGIDMKLGGSIQLEIKQPEIRLDIDMYDSVGAKSIGFGFGLHTAYLGFIKDGDRTAASEFVVANPDGYVDIINDVVTIGAKMTISAKTLASSYIIKDLASFVPGIDLGLIFGDMNRSVSLSLKLDLCINDIISDGAVYKSKAEIRVQIDGYKDIIITTDFTSLLLDLSALDLPKLRIDVDIFELLRPIITGTFIDGFDKGTDKSINASSLATAGAATLTCGCSDANCVANGKCFNGSARICDGANCNSTCDIIQFIAQLVKSIQIGNQKSIVALDGNLLNVITKLLGINMNLPEFSNISIALDNTDKNGNGIDLGDAHMELKIEDKDKADFSLKLHSLYLGATNSGAIVVNKTGYTNYNELSLLIEARAELDLNANDNGNASGMFMGLDGLLSMFLNNVTQASGLYAKGTSPTKFVATLKAYVNLGELFGDATTKTLAFELEVTSNGSQYMKVAYDNAKQLLVINAPAIGIKGLAIPNMLDIVGMINPEQELLTEGSLNTSINATGDSVKKTRGVNPRVNLTFTAQEIMATIQSGALGEIVEMLGIPSEIIPEFDAINIGFNRGDRVGQANNGHIFLGLSVFNESNKNLGIGIKAQIVKTQFGSASAPIAHGIMVSSEGCLNFENLSQIDVTLGGTLKLNIGKSTSGNGIGGPVGELLEMVATMMGFPEGSNPLKLVFGTPGVLEYDFKIDARLDFSTRSNFNANSQISLKVILRTTQGGTTSSMNALSVYYNGADSGIYIDLSNLGLPKVKLGGIDLFGLLSGLLGGTGMIKSVDDYKSVVDYKDTKKSAIGDSLGGLKNSICGCKTKTTTCKDGCVKVCAAIKNEVGTITGFNCPNGTVCSDAACIAAGKCLCANCPQNKKSLEKTDLNCAADCGCSHCVSIGNPVELLLNFSKLTNTSTLINVALNSGLIDQVLAMAGLNFKFPKLVAPIELSMKLDANGMSGAKQSILDYFALKFDFSEETPGTHFLEFKLDTIKLNPTPVDYNAADNKWIIEKNGNVNTFAKSYLPSADELKKYAGLNMDMNNMDIGAIVDNAIDGIMNPRAGYDNNGNKNENANMYFLSAQYVNTTRYVNGSGGISSNRRNSVLQIGKWSNSGDVSRFKDNSLRIYISTNSGTLSAFIAQDKTVYLSVENIPGFVGGIAGLIDSLKQIWITQLNFASMFGGAGGGNVGSDTGNGSSTDNPVTDEDGGTSTPPTPAQGIKDILKEIVITVGGADLVPGKVSTNLNMSSIAIHLQPSMVRSLSQMINSIVIGLAGGSSAVPGNQAVTYLYNYVLTMQSIASLAKNELYGIISSLIPFPEVSDATGNGYVSILLDGNQKPGNTWQAVDKIKLRLWDNATSEEADIVIQNNGISINRIVENPSEVYPIWDNNKLAFKTSRDIQPYSLDANKNGAKDYMENLPREARGSFENKIMYQNGTYPGNVTVTWTDHGKLLDPTVSTKFNADGAPISNYMDIDANIMNFQYKGLTKDAAGRNLYGYISPQNVRRPVYKTISTSTGDYKYPLVSGDGLSYPMVIDPDKGGDLPKVVTVTTENELGEVYPLTFGLNSGDTVTWDTSEIKSHYFGQSGANIYLTYSNGNCKPVRIAIPITVTRKALVGLQYNQDASSYGAVGDPMIFDPYTFKGLPTEVMAIFEGSAEPKQVNIQWEGSVVPDFNGATHIMSALVGNNTIGYQKLNNINVTFLQKKIADVDFSIDGTTADFNTVFKPYDDKRKANDITSYPRRARVYFEDGTFTDNLDLSWNLWDVNTAFDAGTSIAKMRIGDTAGTKQEYPLEITMLDGEITYETLGLNNKRYYYDAFAENGTINPSNPAWYGQDKTTVTFADGSTKEFDIIWDATTIKINYEGGTYFAEAIIGDAYSKKQRIKVPVEIATRVITEVEWDSMPGMVSSPIEINPYTYSLDTSKLPGNVNVTFADGSTVSNKKVSWDTNSLSVNYLGNTTFLNAAFEGAGVQVVKVPVKVQRKVIRSLMMENVTFDPFEFEIDPRNASNYPKSVIAEFEDGTFLRFGASELGNVAPSSSIVWDLSNLENVNYKGGLFNVTARIGSSKGGFQNVRVQVEIQSRVIKEIANLYSSTNKTVVFNVGNIYTDADPRDVSNPMYIKNSLASFEGLDITEFVNIDWDLTSVIQNFKGNEGGSYSIGYKVGGSRIGYQYFNATVNIAKREITANMLGEHSKIVLRANEEMVLPNKLDVDFGQGIVTNFKVEWVDENLLQYNYAGFINGSQEYLTAKIGNIIGGYQFVKIPVTVQDIGANELYLINDRANDLLTKGISINPYDAAITFDQRSIVVVGHNGAAYTVNAYWDITNLKGLTYEGTKGTPRKISLTFGDTAALRQTFEIDVNVKDQTILGVYTDSTMTKKFECIMSPYEEVVLPQAVYVQFMGDSVATPLDVKWSWADSTKSQLIATFISPIGATDQVVNILTATLKMENAQISTENYFVTINPYDVVLPASERIKFTADSKEYTYQLYFDWDSTNIAFKYNGDMTKNNNAVSKGSDGKYEIDVNVGNDNAGYSQTIKVKFAVRDMTVVAIDTEEMTVNPYDLSTVPSYVVALYQDGTRGRIQSKLDRTTLKPAANNFNTSIYDGGMWTADLLLGNYKGGFQTKQVVVNFLEKKVVASTDANAVNVTMTNGKIPAYISVAFTDGTTEVLKVYTYFTNFEGAVAGDGKIYDLVVGTEFAGTQTIKVKLV